MSVTEQPRDDLAGALYTALKEKDSIDQLIATDNLIIRIYIRHASLNAESTIARLLLVTRLA